MDWRPFDFAREAKRRYDQRKARRILVAGGHDPDDLVDADGTTVLDAWMTRKQEQPHAAS